MWREITLRMILAVAFVRSCASGGNLYRFRRPSLTEVPHRNVFRNVLLNIPAYQA